MDFSATGQPVQHVGYGYRVWMQAECGDSLATSPRVIFSVDSARLTPGSIVPLPVDSLGGARWSGRLRPDGHLDSLTPLADRPGAGHFRTILWHFYPRVPRGLREGMQWADTVSQRFAEINGTVTFTAVTRYTAEAVDTARGEPAYRVAGEIDWAQKADLQFTKGMGTMNGSGHGRGVYWLSTTGQTYLGGEQAIVSDLVVARPGVAGLPVHDSSSTRVRIRR